ncbi:MAG: zinc-ribbon domain-containing protein [Desulfosoma sp.]
MLVTCELCGTKYRVDPKRLHKDKVKARCTRCGHTFIVRRTAEPEPEPDFEPMDVAPDDHESFHEPEPQEAVSAARPEPRVLRPPAKERPRSRQALVIAMAAFLCLGIAVAAYYLYSKGMLPTRGSKTDKAAMTSPGIPQVTIDPDIRAYFLENASAGQIFVVEGKAVNEAAGPVSFVLVEGKLYTTEKQPAQVQKAYCGNIMSREELMRMDMTQIQNAMMNREGKDLSNVHIPSMGKVPFMVVFHNLPELSLLSDYSVEVVNAQADK